MSYEKWKIFGRPCAVEPVYPPCYAGSEAPPADGSGGLEADLAYMIDRVKRAPTYDYPFKAFTYFCDIWPPALW